VTDKPKKTLDELIKELGEVEKKVRIDMMKSFFYAQHLEEIRAMDEAYYREQTEADK